MEKRVREISRFFVAPRREFDPAFCAHLRTFFFTSTSTLVDTSSRVNKTYYFSRTEATMYSLCPLPFPNSEIQEELNVILGKRERERERESASSTPTGLMGVKVVGVILTDQITDGIASKKVPTHDTGVKTMSLRSPSCRNTQLNERSVGWLRWRSVAVVGW